MATPAEIANALAAGIKPPAARASTLPSYMTQPGQAGAWAVPAQPGGGLQWGGANQSTIDSAMRMQSQPNAPGAQQPGFGSVAAPQGQNMGTGMQKTANGWKLPSGEELPSWASNTRTIAGQQVTSAGIYQGNGQALWANNGTQENADGRYSRRLEELHNGGYNVQDPNVQYEAMARVRDDAIAALSQRLGHAPSAAELQQATGFAHIDRFVRGANGETGFQGAGGVQNAAQQTAPNPLSGTPAAGAHPPANNNAVPPATTSTTQPPAPGAAGAPPAAATPPPLATGQSVQQTGDATQYGYKPVESMLYQDASKALYNSFAAAGIDLTKPGPLQDFIRQRFAPIISAAVTLGNGNANDPNAAAALKQRIDSIAQSAIHGDAGTMFNNLHQIGANALNNNSQYLNGLQNQDDAIKYMQQGNMLAGSNYNPLYQQATSDMLSRDALRYNTLYPSQQAAAGKDTDPFQQWFSQNSPYAPYFTGR